MQKNKPNIIFLLTDDQTYWSATSMGRPEAKTPNIDRLASQGMVFDRYYDTSAICMASRATIVTGKYEYKNGCNFEHGALLEQEWLQSYPVILRNNGYFTGFAGKVGFNVSASGSEYDEIRDLKNDFDMYGGLAGGQGYYETEKNEHMAHYAKRYPHVSRALGQFGVDFIKKTATGSKPFCLSISFKAPHNPMTPDPFFDDVYKDTVWQKPGNYGPKAAEHLAAHIRTGRQWIYYDTWDGDEVFQEHSRKYHQLIHGVDYAIKMIRDELNQQGMSDNTVVIFTSDNGYFHGSHGLGGKVLAYEEATRVPLIIYDPRHPCSGKQKRCRKVAGNIDIASTILELTGIGAGREMDGKNLMKLLDDPFTDIHEELGLYNFWNAPPALGQAVVRDRYKYIYYWYEGEGMAATEELFDLDNDPLEMHNLAKDSQMTEVLKDMRETYDKQLGRLCRDAVKRNNYDYYGELFDRRKPFGDKREIFAKFMDAWLDRMIYSGGQWLEDVENNQEWGERVKAIRQNPGLYIRPRIQ